MAGERIQLEMITRQRMQSVEASPHVARTQAQVHAHAGQQVHHGRNASSTRRSVAVLATVFSSANCTGSLVPYPSRFRQK
jgi:hypothetical protein